MQIGLEGVKTRACCTGLVSPQESEDAVWPGGHVGLEAQPGQPRSQSCGSDTTCRPHLLFWWRPLNTTSLGLDAWGGAVRG